MSDSDSSQKQKKSSPKKTQVVQPQSKSPQIQSTSNQRKRRQMQGSLVSSIVSKAPIIQDQTGLYQQNRKLRRKLKQLSMRLDDQLQKAAQNKLKQANQINGRPVSLQAQPLQLQNAYKMIQRLQKTVKDYQSKQSYQITVKRIMDLQGIVKKKDTQIQTHKTQVKTLKKMLHQKQRHVAQLLQNSKKMNNPAQDKQTISKLKQKLKKLAEQRDTFKKNQLNKHEKLVNAQRRIVQMEQDHNEMPIGKEESLLKEIQELKDKYKQAMQRVERQNIYITKLNQKLSRDHQRSRKSQRKTQQITQTKKISRSMEQLPGVKKKINSSQLLQHLPSPQAAKLRRY